MRILSYWEKLKKKWWVVKGPINYRLFFAILFLVVYGIVMIYSASYYSAGNLKMEPYQFMYNQTRYTLFSLVVMLFVSRIDYHVWLRFGTLAVVLSFVLELLLKVPGIGVNSHGATRWLNFRVISFQAAEPIKTFLMVFYARHVRDTHLKSRQSKVKIWLVTGLLAGGMWILADNMSTALIMVAICYIICLVCDPEWKKYAIAAGALFGFALLFLLFVEFVLPVSPTENFRITRIRAFLHPEDYLSSTGLQPKQALYAIGAGGFWGRGLGQSLMKFRLSEPYNDYILAIICEEMGVFGVCMILFLFSYLLCQIAKVASSAADVEGRIFCVGVFAQIAVQAALNFLVVTNLFPTTGVTLPFVSYGGASALFLMVELGVVFSIDNVAKNRKFRREAVKIVNEQDRKRALQSFHY